MRKILYSPGYGAGWVSWHHGSEEEKKFMLSYPAFIEAVETPETPSETHRLRAEAAANKALIAHMTIQGWGTKTAIAKSIKGEWDRIPTAIVKAIPKFIKDWRKKFPGKELPYLGGLRDLEVCEVADHALVKIDEYDGFESVRVHGEEEDWL